MRPLLLCSLCQGRLEEEAPAGRAAAAERAAASPIERVQIPEGIPLELLQDTVEYQQMQLLEQEQALREEEEGARAAQRAQQEAMDGGSTGGERLPVVDVQASWSLSRAEHLALLQRCLLPLAQHVASSQLAARLTPEQCPPFEQEGGAIHAWVPLQLSALLDTATTAAAATALPASDAASSGGGATPENGVPVLAALVAAVAQAQPVTILTSEALPFGNCEVPLDTGAALYLSMGSSAEGGAGAAGPGPQLARLRQQLVSLVPGSEARRRTTAGAAAQQDGSAGGIMQDMQAALVVRGGGQGCVAPRLDSRCTRGVHASNPGARAVRRTPAWTAPTRHCSAACCACSAPAISCAPRVTRWGCWRRWCVAWQTPLQKQGLKTTARRSSAPTAAPAAARQ